MGGSVTSPQQLDLAISGLAGIAGWLLLPTMTAWLRLFVRWLDADRSVLAARRRWSGSGLLRAGSYSVLLVFVLASLLRAAGELREVRVEAPVFADAVTAGAVGIGLWGVFALILRVLVRDFRRVRHERRHGSVRL
ncbi:MAG: hypothetical protein B7733_03725 [Myxococcales bacterium FL481]|nr:MAG: hypothetical protein B7733_03725 [Myxococcales bacterium FL481]